MEISRKVWYKQMRADDYCIRQKYGEEEHYRQKGPCEVPPAWDQGDSMT